MAEQKRHMDVPKERFLESLTQPCCPEIQVQQDHKDENSSDLS